MVFLPTTVLAHVPLSGDTQSSIVSSVSALLLFALWLLYVIGARRQPPHWQQAACFHAAFFICVVAVFGPIDTWAETNAAAHMSQHMLMMVIIPPLWVLSRPLPQINSGLSASDVRQRSEQKASARNSSARTNTERYGSARKIGALLWTPWLRLARHPLWTAWLHGAVIWLWHLPRFYVLALEEPWWHFIEHTCFLFTGGLFWWSVLRSAKQEAAWALLSVLFTLMHTGFLGALLTFARTPLYIAAYQADAEMTIAISQRLAEQQLAGLIMWVAGGFPYLIAAVWIALRWYQQLARQMQSRA